MTQTPAQRSRRYRERRLLAEILEERPELRGDPDTDVVEVARSLQAHVYGEKGGGMVGGKGRKNAGPQNSGDLVSPDRGEKEWSMIDLHDVDEVEIRIRADGTVVWINIDGRCAVRCHAIDKLIVADERPLLADTEIDTSDPDMPEQGEEFFKRAKLRLPKD